MAGTRHLWSGSHSAVLVSNAGKFPRKNFSMGNSPKNSAKSSQVGGSWWLIPVNRWVGQASIRLCNPSPVMQHETHRRPRLKRVGNSRVQWGTHGNPSILDGKDQQKFDVYLKTTINDPGVL